MNAETRQLLEGDEKRSARNLPKMGFGDATGAPLRFAQRIAEVRACIIARRPIPAPSAEYRAAANFEKSLFPQQRANQHVETTTTTNVEKLRRMLDAAKLF